MPDRPFLLPLNPRGDLDTAMPVTDRPPGTLTEAKDAHYRYIGPKRGSGAFTRAWEGPGTASLYDGIAFTSGASTFGQGLSFDDGFRDVGTKFTLDVWFRLTSTAYASTKDKIGLYKFVANASGVIELAITGPAHATPGLISAYLITNPTRGTTDSPVTLLGSYAFSVGSAQTDKHHVRWVRDGANGYLYMDGQAHGSTSSYVATSPIQATYGTAASVGLGNMYIGSDLTVTLKGSIYGAVLRDGAYTTDPIEAVMPCNPMSRNVHHYYLGRNIALGGVDHFFDASRYGAHARMNGADYTVTSSNDNTFPAPSPVQAMRTWLTRTNRTVSSAMCGGIHSSEIVA